MPMESGGADGARFVWPVRVYFEDTDAGGVVYHANFLRFMERARTEWLRQCGLEQDDLRSSAGVVFVVRSAQLELKRPARFNDLLSVTCRPNPPGRASMDFMQSVYRDDLELASARIRLACVDLDRFVPVAIPARVLNAIEAKQGE